VVYVPILMAKEEVITPSPKNGPVLTIRLRSKQDLKQVKKAAEDSGLSLNTWATEVLSRASRA